MIDTPAEFLDKLEALDKNRAARLLRIERDRRDVANEVRWQHIDALEQEIADTAEDDVQDALVGIMEAVRIIKHHKVTW